MKKIKEHFQLIIVLFLLIVTVSITYYYIYVLPKYSREKIKLEREKQAEELRARKEECREIGEKVYKQDQKELEGYASYLFEPQYSYNEELNTCLYSGGFSKGDYWQRWVKDSYTNKTILATSYIRGQKDDESQTEKIGEYWAKHKELFR